MVYATYCVSCHQSNGKGDGNRFPLVAQSEWVNGDRSKLINVILNGLQGSVKVKGLLYNEVMPAHCIFLKERTNYRGADLYQIQFGNTPEALLRQQK